MNNNNDTKIYLLDEYAGFAVSKEKKSNEMIKEQLGKAEIIDFDPLVLHDSLTKYNNLITKRKLVFNYRIYQPKSFRTNINLHNYLLQLKSYTLLLAPLKKKKKKKKNNKGEYLIYCISEWTSALQRICIPV